MGIKTVVSSQYLAALEMLQQAIRQCPMNYGATLNIQTNFGALLTMRFSTRIFT